jgi:hypothetical protein
MERHAFVPNNFDQCYLGRYSGLRIIALLSWVVQLRVLRLHHYSRLYLASLRCTCRVLDCDSHFSQRLGRHFSRMLSEETGRMQEILCEKAPQIHPVFCKR